jgi:hypothetical protein
VVSTGRVLVAAGSVAAIALAAHTVVNLRLLRRPRAEAPTVVDAVDVLIPARDEADHIETTVRSVLAQSDVPHLTVTVLDDGSTDDTARIVADIAAEDLRVRLLRGGDAPLPAQWLGKPWACARLADSATGSILCFVDADVTLEPFAVRALVETLRLHDLQLVAPYPHQVAGTWLERLVQPLVTWSWVATMPVRWAELSGRPSLSAANGQVLVFDAAGYRQAGGHTAVRGDVIEDVALMRAIRRSGGRAATVDGSHLASCRMYDSPGALVDGYAKSLWSAFNGPVGAAAVNALLVAVYVLPVAGLLSRSRSTRVLAMLGYGAGVTSRALVSSRTGERTWPDALAHPASIVAFCVLNAVSWQRHLNGTTTWKGRPVTAGGSA